jgi:hypothetical protein
MDSSVVTALDEETSVLEVAVRGQWSVELWLLAHRTLRKEFAEHPAGLLLDLRELTDPKGESAIFWFTARARGNSLRPPMPVVVCLHRGTPLADALSRLPVHHFETTAEAHAALADQLLWPGLLRLRLPPEPTSAAVARRAATEACERWDLAQLADRARLVVSELVVNAAEHAGTRIDVTLAKVAASLHVGVRDLSQARPRVLPFEPGGEVNSRGQGLRLVEAAAYRWGIAPSRIGKTVWAVLR